MQPRGPRTRGPRSSWRRFGWLLVPAAVSAAVIWLSASSAFHSADLLFQGFLYRTAPPREDHPVTIIAIDASSLSALTPKYGQYPWRRSAYADLLAALRGTHPMAVAFDIGLFDRTDDDASLAAMLADYPAPVVLPVMAPAVDGPGTSGMYRASSTTLPLPEYRDAPSVSLGFANVLQEADGTVRRIPVEIDGVDAGILPSFSVATLRAAFGIDPERDPLLREDDGVRLARQTYRFLGGTPQRFAPTLVPTDASHSFLVNYTGGAQAFPVVSFASVLDGTASPDLLRDRMLLVGATDVSLHDIVNRPSVSERQLPGVEVHAHAIATLLSGDTLSPVRSRETAALVLLYAVLSALIAWKLRSTRSVTAMLALVLTLPVVAAVLFSLTVFGDTPGRLVSLVYPFVAALASYVGVLLIRVTTGESDRARLRRAFTRYLSPEIVRELLVHPEKLKLGGERRTLTVLFSDIRGFTSLSEKLEAEDLVGLLNEYFSIQSDIIFEHRGVIDKFIGDALMAFWGAPLEDPLQAERACASALAMVRSVTPFNAILVERGLPPIAMGVGVNTGPAIVGNMGSARRFDYTAMGDTVNLASRLEGLTKAYGVPMLVSERTRSGASGAFHFRTVDRVKVKGKQEAVLVSEILSASSEGERPAWAERFERALEDAWSRKWDAAEEGFRSVLAERPDDGPSTVFLARLRAWKELPPPEGWDGSASFDHK